MSAIRIFLLLVAAAVLVAAMGCTPEQVRVAGGIAGAVGQTATLTGNAPCAAVAAGVAAFCDLYAGGGL